MLRLLRRSSCALLLLCLALPSLAIASPPESITRGLRTSSDVVLSFDAGSTDRGAGEILDILRQHEIRTTIFVTGHFIRKYPDLVRRIVEEGHEVGNHSFSHPRLTTYAKNHRQTTRAGVTRELVQQELRDTEQLFAEVTGVQMSKYWRAPYGEHNAEIRQWAAELGYVHIGWTSGADVNLDSLDWVTDRSSPRYMPGQKITERLIRFASNETSLNGGIILMHLGTDRQESQRVTATLDDFIIDLQKKGFRFVKVSELESKLRDAG